MSSRKKKTAAEIARIMSERDTDDDLSDVENGYMPDTVFNTRAADVSYESSTD